MRRRDLEIIKELIEIMKRENLTQIEIKKPFLRIKLTRENILQENVVRREVEVIPREKIEKKEIPEKEIVKEEIKEDNFYILKSPLVGTFYRAPSPESPPYVEVGEEVRKGQILCIIEAMKIMNEIESEVDGKIVEIMVKNGEPVEYGQPLFKIEVRK